MLDKLALCSVVFAVACGSQQSENTTTTTTAPSGENVATAKAPVTKPVAAPVTKNEPVAEKLPSFVEPYRATARKIIKAALADKDAWKKLAYLSDRIGHRLSGSRAMARAVDWAARTMKAEGHVVRKEKVMVPHWVRGVEQASITAPVKKPMRILALGGSVGTPRRGIQAPVLVATSFKNLVAQKAQVKGKIVLYNVAMPKYHPKHGAGYGKTVAYRWAGPSVAAKMGAVGVLMRSVTAHSLNSPHTGSLGYTKGVKKIPAAAVTVEDAELIARLAKAGPVKVKLRLGARTLPDKPSANVIGELRGREKPDEIVLIGAHLDSWDVGQGAHDDGAGCVMMMQALTLLKKLKLTPRRTIRVVLFTNEENGGRGNKAYFKEHAAEVPKHVAAMEADTGSFAPLGLRVAVEDKSKRKEAVAKIAEILSLLEPIKATRARVGHGGADIGLLRKAGVLALGLDMDGSKYFDYHHTHADTLDKVDPKQLVRNLATVAVAAYILAEMPGRILPPAVVKTPGKPVKKP